VINTFRHRGLERYFRTGSLAGIEPKHAARLRLQLGRLDSAQSPRDMDLPGGCCATRLRGLSLDASNVLHHHPPHPGEVLADTVLGTGRLTVSVFARRLGVSRVALSRVVNGRAAISADMALRLADALGGSPESWLHMQVAYDLWRASRRRRPRIRPVSPQDLSG